MVSPQSISLAESHLCGLLFLYTLRVAKVDLETGLCSVLFGPGNLGLVQRRQSNVCGLTKPEAFSLIPVLMDSMASGGAEQSGRR